ncbi:MAG: helix-turn-helix transcriptional regulator [Parvibaculum sp.]
MKTRIRYHRKLRRLTQSDVAKLIGTTAATVSRLETAEMNVSMTWLQRFADAFNVPVSDLIEFTPTPGRIPCIGEIGRSGALFEAEKGQDDDIKLESLSRNPVAIRIRENFGQYCVGDVIIADRMSAEHVIHAIGRDCVVEIEGEEGGFGRLISSDNGTYLLVPPEPGAKVRSFPLPNWVAPVVMLIRHL